MTLNVSYGTMGDAISSVYFEVYDKNPCELIGNTLTKVTEDLPLYSGYTNSEGQFSASLILPEYLSKVYIYTPMFFAQTLIEANVEGGVITATDYVDIDASLSKTRAGSSGYIYKSDAVTVDGWQTWLGMYDESTGEITGFADTNEETILVSKTDEKYPIYNTKWNGYYYIAPDGTTINIRKWYDKNGKETSKGTYYYRVSKGTYPGYAYTEATAGDKYDAAMVAPASLMTAHGEVINISKTCPPEYRSSTDMHVVKPSEIVVTMLGGNTCWNSSMGYYFYQDGDVPTSYEDIKKRVILLFPNTQDGKWSNNIAAATKTQGVERGTAVQLKYYPNIESGSRDGETTIFPAGTRVGFVLATNAWTNRISGFTANKKYRAATSSGLSINNSGVAFGVPRTAVYKYNDWVMFSFEDHTNDENFSDVVFTLKSNPVDAISDVPVYDTESQTTTFTVNIGMHSFEDMWPQAGDYDMNDVMVKSTYERVIRTVINFKNGVEDSRKYKLLSEAYMFKTYQNFATLINGLAFRVVSGNAQNILPSAVKFFKKEPNETKFTEYQPIADDGQFYRCYSKDYPAQEQDLFMLTDNLANLYNTGNNPDPIGTTYRAEFIYGTKDNIESGIEASNIQDFVQSDIETFVTRVHSEDYDGNGGDYDYRLEIHVPYEAPSNSSGMLDHINFQGWAYLRLWNQYDDASNPFRTDGEPKTYYLRSEYRGSSLYPFAFFLSGATENDLSPLLSPKNESKKIDVLFPNYSGWVNSKGESNKDWYKK